MTVTTIAPTARLMHRLRRRAFRSATAGLAVDLRAWLRQPEREAALWRDFLRTWRQCGGFRDGVPVAARGARRALVLPFGTVQTAKQEALLAGALRRHGWAVAPVLSRAQPWVRRYYAALGIAGGGVLRQDFAPDADDLAACAAAAREIGLRGATVREVKDWTYQGLRIGSPLLSSVQRAQRAGAPDPRDPAFHQRLETALPQILAWIGQFRRILDAVRPELLMLIEANDWNSPIVDLAVERGIDVIQFHQPSREDAIIFKRLNRDTRRYHANSVSAELLARMDERAWTEVEEAELAQEFADRYGGTWVLQQRNQPGTTAKSKDEIIAMLELDPAKKIAVVFSHILWDANLFFGEDLFEDYGEWLVETVRAAVGNPGLNWVIKLHPANLWKRALEKASGELAEITVLEKAGLMPLPPHVRLLRPETDISTLSLFQSIDYGITVRGTSGIELPCFGVPTLTAGTGRYSGLGFTVDAADRAEYLGRLARLQTLPPMTPAQTRLAKRHAHTLFRHRPCVFSSFRTVLDKSLPADHPLSYNLDVIARSWDEVARNGDLARFAAWASDRGRPVDFCPGL